MRKRRALFVCSRLGYSLEYGMNKHLLKHALACAVLNRVVEVIVVAACVIAFGWLWSLGVVALVTASRCYVARVSYSSVPIEATGEES